MTMYKSYIFFVQHCLILNDCGEKFSNYTADNI
jgi:hypothetical protein